MKKGYLSQYIEGVAWKKLSEVEADPNRSHQHEFNGVADLRLILGEPEGLNKISYETDYIYFTDYDDEPVFDKGIMTWYDARAKARLQRGVDRHEYRLYFQDNRVMQCAAVGDTLLIAKQRGKDTLLAIVAENESTIATQLMWLFGMNEVDHPGFSVRSELETEQDRIEFASRVILETIGIVVEPSADKTFLDAMLEKFQYKFPPTAEFSNYARSTLPDIDPIYDNPDSILPVWMEREEILFRTLERYLIAEKLQQNFNGDVDGFLSFSLSVHNRRKSRAGYALENHIAALFDAKQIRYSRSPNTITENKAKPDFIFPGIAEYHDSCFDTLKLTMLGVKTTCKDRWRQVLSEAHKINKKHLLTLEPAISINQTMEMQAHGLQLVIPLGIHTTYTEKQRQQLMTVADFIGTIQYRQS